MVSPAAMLTLVGLVRATLPTASTEATVPITVVPSVRTCPADSARPACPSASSPLAPSVALVAVAIAVPLVRARLFTPDEAGSITVRSLSDDSVASKPAACTAPRSAPSCAVTAAAPVPAATFTETMSARLMTSPLASVASGTL